MQNPDIATLEIHAPEAIASPVRMTPQEEPEHMASAGIEYADLKAYDADEVEEERLLIVEETLTAEARDTREIGAAKVCINELLTRKTQTRPCVARTKRCGQVQVFDERPGICDFAADILLAAKHSLSAPLLRVFQWALAEDFERWLSVPVGVRQVILQRMGENLLRRKIVSRTGNTREYFSVGIRQRGSPCPSM